MQEAIPARSRSSCSAKKDAEYTVLVDNAASKENVTRYAEHEGYSVTVSENGGEYTLSLKK